MKFLLQPEESGSTILNCDSLAAEIFLSGAGLFYPSPSQNATLGGQYPHISTQCRFALSAMSSYRFVQTFSSCPVSSFLYFYSTVFLAINAHQSQTRDCQSRPPAGPAAEGVIEMEAKSP
jgi:hypothetical protein